MMSGYLVLCLVHPFNLIQVSFFSLISFIVSTNLKQQISSHLKIVNKNMEVKPVVVKPKPVELMKMSVSTGGELMRLMNDEEKKNVSELVIEEGCGNELKEDMKICGFDYLKKLIVKKNSWQNLNSLVISNNDELEIIEIEDGDYKTGAFYNVKIVEISSIL